MNFETSKLGFMILKEIISRLREFQKRGNVMENIQSNNLKIISKKMIVMMLIVLGVTFIMGLIFVFNTEHEFLVTRTVWATMTEGVDGDTPGGGELILISAVISGMTFLGELTLVIIIIVMFLVIPIVVNLLTLIISLIARLFQIGESKNWKNMTTKVLLYVSIVLQGLLSIYILVLCFTGYGLVYITVYLMLTINVYGVVKNILNNINGKKNQRQNELN